MVLKFSVNPDEYEPEDRNDPAEDTGRGVRCRHRSVVRDEFEPWFAPRLRIEPAVYDALTEGVLGDLDAVPATRC